MFFWAEVSENGNEITKTCTWGESMNTDIRLLLSFKGHRKRRRLRTLLGPGATDYLIDFWLTVAQDRPSGALTGWDETDIALAAGWEGEPQLFVDAMMQAGFLEHGEDGVYRPHDWAEHQPWVIGAPERSRKAKHAADSRWGNTAKSMPDACSPHATSMPDAMRVAMLNDAPSPSPKAIKNKAHYSNDTSLKAIPPLFSEPSATPCPGCFKHLDTHKKYLAQCERLNLALGAATMNAPTLEACKQAAESFCKAMSERDVEWCKPSLGLCYPNLIEPRLQREINAAMAQASVIHNRRRWAQTWLKQTLARMPTDDGAYERVGYLAKGRSKP